MMIHRIGPGWTGLTVLCILMIFFFPANFGPYSVVHGPVSALRANQAALRLQFAMFQAAVGSVATSCIPLFVSGDSLVVTRPESCSASFPDFSTTTILRC